MPTYEYACTECEYEFEAFHSITAEPIRLCPECGEQKVERLISGGAGLIFKGRVFISPIIEVMDTKKQLKKIKKQPATKNLTQKNQRRKRLLSQKVRTLKPRRRSPLETSNH